MPLTYKLTTAMLAFTGSASLVATGQMNPLVLSTAIVLFYGYYRFMKGYLPAPKWAVGTFSLMTLAVFIVDSMIISGDTFLAVAHLTISFQAIKSFDLREPWDHLQVYFMSLLQLIIASELTSSIVFGGVFLFFIVLLVTAMVFSHFLKAGSLGKFSIKLPVILISLFTIAATVLFFVAVPRTQQKLFGKGHAKKIKTAGFSEKVDFGAFGEVKIDPTVVMRVEMDTGLTVPYYWRGLTMDYFDGRSWSNTGQRGMPVKKIGEAFVFSETREGLLVRQSIHLEPIDSDVVFAFAEVLRLNADAAALTVDEAMNISMPRRFSRRTTYTAYSVISDGYRMKNDKKYLQMPTGMENIIRLADETVSGTKGDMQKSRIIEQYLKNNYMYSLDTSAPPSGVNAIEDFLFNTKKGYCEHYATAMVLMLRGLGIPSRIVNGFYGGEKNRYGGYVIVRQRNAHSWVEAFIGDRWMRFDPTPAVPENTPALFSLFIDSLKLNWSRYVVGFSSHDQKGIAGMLLSVHALPQKIFSKKGQVYLPWGLLFFLTAAVLFIFILKKRTSRNISEATAGYLGLISFLRRKGIQVRPSMTPGELKRDSSQLEMRKSIDEFIEQYEKYRFGRKEMDRDERQTYRMNLRKIKKG